MIFIGAIFNNPEILKFIAGGVPKYDLELKLEDLNYSDWLPVNYVTQGGSTYNSVVPNTQVLDQVRFYVKTGDNSVLFMMRFPEGDVVQEYVRN